MTAGTPKKAATTKIGTADYAKVAERIRLFREDNPRGLIETMPQPQTDGSLIFKARILKDKADVNSAESTAHAHSAEANLKKDKGFEKLESIAVGRALANLGYMASGDIASSEEMEEYESFKKQKDEEKAEADIIRINACTSLPELIEVWKDCDKRSQLLLAAKDAMKARLTSGIASEFTGTGEAEPPAPVEPPAAKPAKTAQQKAKDKAAASLEPVAGLPEVKAETLDEFLEG